jgi:hypothetical protein
VSLAFGTPASTSAPSLSFQGLSTAVTTAAKPFGSLTFGTSPAVTSTTGFNLSTPATTSQGTGFTLGGTATSTSGGGLFGLGVTKPLLFSPATTTTTSIGLAGTSIPSTTTTSIGLGGVDTTQTKSGLTGEREVLLFFPKQVMLHTILLVYCEASDKNHRVCNIR